MCFYITKKDIAFYVVNLVLLFPDLCCLHFCAEKFREKHCCQFYRTKGIPLNSDLDILKSLSYLISFKVHTLLPWDVSRMDSRNKPLILFGPKGTSFQVCDIFINFCDFLGRFFKRGNSDVFLWLSFYRPQRRLRQDLIWFVLLLSLLSIGCFWIRFSWFWIFLKIG